LLRIVFGVWFTIRDGSPSPRAGAGEFVAGVKQTVGFEHLVGALITQRIEALTPFRMVLGPVVERCAKLTSLDFVGVPNGQFRSALLAGQALPEVSTAGLLKDSGSGPALCEGGP
jgi:hypothetical protein